MSISPTSLSTLGPAPPALPACAMPGHPAAWPAAGTTDGWTASTAISHLSFTLRAPAWHRPPVDRAAPPLVIVGHDYVPPPAVEAASPPMLPPAAVDGGWTGGLSSDDPFARLLAGLAHGQPDAIWPG